MMTILVFNPDGVRRVVEHMTSVTKWWGDYEHEHQARPQLVFVKDHGIYLMSNGVPRDLVDGDSSFVVYAQGYDPSEYLGEYDSIAEVCDKVSGDDFGESVDLTSEQIALIRSPDFRSLVIRLDEHTFEILIETYSAQKIEPGRAH